ncbi:oxygenase MpaB family protein [Cellulomonas edaphi]|uniref:Oxygenase MpaB family protein n=1 Tax=Cellulomonas edaphi TaxID=3053468 RepID=A0ABT7S3V5_9CELL|nr:oxygenase MpaB family protein [Cellulomons edaphi]MDM7830308.1 oxygenase MpaB family protein [Cellulomons edaphi]
MVLSPLRRRAGDALFARVAGPDGPAARARIHETPGPRWFEPGSPVRVVHGDASMFVGGIRALLLQALHPAAMAGVAGHSGYKSDPWGRLARTSTFLAVTAFGTADDAQAAVDRVRAIHERVRGTSPDGVRYRASDPDLLRWVHVAEIDSFVTAHRLVGEHPLDDAGYDGYVAQMATVADRLGVIDAPTTVAALDDQLEDYRAELAVSSQARDTIDFLLREPPVPKTLRLPYKGLSALAVSSLQPWARAMVEPGRERSARRDGASLRAGSLVTKLIRWSLAGTPDAPRPAPAGAPA